MAKHDLGNGIVVDAPDDFAIEREAPAAPVSAPPRRGARGLPTGRVSLGGGAPAVGAEDPVVAAMRAQDLELVDTFGLAPVAGAPRRAAPGPTRMTITVEPDEDSVVLFEQDGVYAWRYPTEATTIAPAARRGAVQPRAKRQLSFDLTVQPVTSASTRGRRGPIRELVAGKIKTYVFKFVARVAAGAAIGFLERKKRTGLVQLGVDDPTQWKPVERLSDLALPAARPARVLLLVHGTFSSTLGCYGALGVTPSGRAFLARARSQYDAVIGYDHRTLSRDPLENAQDMLGRLEGAAPRGLEIDAVAHSRGGLVLRSMIEHLLPKTKGVRVRRAVFVGATNAGTLLAAHDNWDELIDLTTNLVSIGSKVLSLYAPAAVAATIVRESVDTLGALVKVLASELTAQEVVPGLAAMVPDGAFVTEINKTQPGQPMAAESLYYVVSSEFDVEGILGGNGASEFPARLAGWFASALAGSLMREPNDLVVHTASMDAIDAGVGGFVKDRWHFQKNPHVYHTVYFTRDEVVRAITRWFQMDSPSERAPVGAPAGAEHRLVVVGAHEPLKSALDAIRAADPQFVIAERSVGGPTPYRYAFRTDEVLALGKTHGPSAKAMSFQDATRGTSLEMHENTSTPEAPANEALSAPSNDGLTGTRLIVVEAGSPRGVIERGVGIRPTLPLDVRAGGGVRRGPRAKPPGPLPEASPPGPTSGEEAAAAPKSATLFVSGEMPQEIPVGDAAVVNVAVSKTQLVISAGPTAATLPFVAATQRPLVVQVVAKKNLTTVDEDFAEIDPSEARTDLVFRVRAETEGPGEVWVQVSQGPRVLAKLVLKPTILAAGVAVGNKRAVDAADGTAAAPDAATYPVLQIFEIESGGKRAYHFVLQIADSPYLSVKSKTFEKPREQYVDYVYKQIEERWLENKDDFEDFEQELRVFGATLLDELVPIEVQKALWQERNRLRAIQVVAEEPFVPWELVHLKDPGAPLSPERHFLGEKGLVRWLHNQPSAPVSVNVRSDRSFYVIPDYAPAEWKLPEAQKEIPFLQKKFKSTPIAGKSGAITKLLGTPGAVDHFHFSGHGAAETANAVFAQLLLDGVSDGQSWTPRYLTADTIAQTAQLTGADGSRPMVVLNACQVGRAGWRLTSIGGFAQSFISRGAGIFVGSLWSVGDKPARTFAESFYGALLQGKSLADAATAGRDAARTAGDGTYLAFVVYGTPHARVSVGAQGAGSRPAPR